jgi:hypothetical protein
MKSFLLFTVLILGLTLSACASGALPIYVASSNISFLENFKEDAFKEYSKRIVQNRLAFESDIDRFYLNSLILSEQEQLLTSQGILYLNRKEEELRIRMDLAEAQSIRNLNEYLNSLDRQINLNKRYLNSVIELQRENAERTIRLALQIEATAQKLQENAAQRREIQMINAQARLEEAKNRSTELDFQKLLMEMHGEVEEPKVPEPITPEVPVS